MADMNLIEAIHAALNTALKMDESVVLLGEDVGVNGGVFRATDGLQTQFGVRRVMDTPLAETAIAGVSIGMAMQGLKPVAEIQFMGFIYAAVEQMVSHGARIRTRTRGRLSCPMVLRVPYGGGIHAPEHHSESTEALFAHVPGIRVVVPASPRRAYGLLLAAIQDPDPVLFLEPKQIYRSQREPVQDDGQPLPLDTCFTLQEGKDVTLVAWGAMIPVVLAAAETLRVAGISCEVIDVATLSPLDMATIGSSVRKTGRCVIVHEAARSCGVGAEIAASLSEDYLFSLRGPVVRVTGFDAPIPYFRLEHYYLPDEARITEAVTRLMADTT